MKIDPVFLATAAGLALIAAACLPAEPRLVWNRTASMPAGAYLIGSKTGLVVGDVVAFRPGESDASWLQSRRYSGHGWPLIKRIAALKGDEVCRKGQSVHINGRFVAWALEVDSAGQRLPAWQGCKRLQDEDIFLLSDHARSIDGRYLGVQPAGGILGRATRLWPSQQTASPSLETGPELSTVSGAQAGGSSDGGSY